MGKTEKQQEPERTYDSWSHCYLEKVSPTERATPPGFAERYQAIHNQEAGLRNMLNGVAAFVAQQQTELEKQKSACWESLRQTTGAGPDLQMTLENNLRKLLIHSGGPPRQAKLVISEPPKA